MGLERPQKLASSAIGINHRLSDLIGNTPLLELQNYAKKSSLNARIVAKLEYFNPAGSIKDRITWAIPSAASEDACSPR